MSTQHDESLASPTILLSLLLALQTSRPVVTCGVIVNDAN